MAQANHPTEAAPRLRGQRVLVVDDEPALVALLTATLEHEGADVLPALTADEALRLMDRGPDLAIIDVNLGSSRDGFDLLRDLRRQSAIPVIMLTGLTEEENAVRGLSLGADDYMRKPFSRDELVARVEARLRRTSMQRPSGLLTQD
jgi:DNA-binding response OmpR family regulator